MFDFLRAHHASVRKAFGEEAVKIRATLVAIAVDGAAMGRLVKKLGDLRMVSQACWSAGTTE
jgi:hypothetical protein